MSGINFLAVIAAAIAAFIISGLWYSPVLFGKQWLVLRGIDPATLKDTKLHPQEIIGELLRTFIIAVVLAHFVVLLAIVSFWGGLNLAIWIWVGFYAMILAGSVIHDKVPFKLAAIHAGDGLVRIILMTIIIAIWR
jgi:hypothetical protein